MRGLLSGSRADNQEAQSDIAGSTHLDTLERTLLEGYVRKMPTIAVLSAAGPLNAEVGKWRGLSGCVDERRGAPGNNELSCGVETASPR